MTALTTLAPRRDWDPIFVRAHPALGALASAAARFASSPDWPDLPAWNDRLADLRLTSGSGAALRFVAQAPRGRRPMPGVERYECRVFDRGEVPSRARSWHDFFNMLCWATFPRAKAALNRRQRAAVTRLGLDDARRLPNARSREQDALAMLDEGGFVVLTAVALDEALARGDVDAVEAAVAAGAARALVVGHAVYEHMVSSDAVVRALPVAVAVPRVPPSLVEAVACADAGLAARLDDARFLAEPPPSVALPMRRSLFEAAPHEPP